MRADARCRSCGAPIRWAVHIATGKRLPLNAEADPAGNLGVVEWDEEARTPIVAVNPSPGTQATPYRYTSHFASCPQANDWRKQR